MTGRGFVISAPSSGAGKTTVTLGLLRALRDVTRVQPAKSGPDYIDPDFHEAACGVASVNLDAWAMSGARLKALALTPDLLVVEGAMGLFDGAPPAGDGSTAHVAKALALPVVLVLNARAMSHSVAALVRGFCDHDPDVHISGVILNNVASGRHEAMLRTAISALGVPVLGALPARQDISLPSRHLGLVQAREHRDLDAKLDTMGDLVRANVDLDALMNLAQPLPAPANTQSIAGKRIAVAQDAAFSFTYTHQLADWRQFGTVLPFSPLANEAVPEADEVFLPGGYPELHGAALANADRFHDSLREMAASVPIRGECGGYMALGEAIVDADGVNHKMAGLLPLVTSFADRKRHLGYRTLKSRFNSKTWRGHEFHYATTVRADGTPALDAWDAEGNDLGPMGLIEGNVWGSFAHLID
ncbi:MAG: cobyrinate a,c-diamide synthase [Rhodobacteraceae bacterium]|nr:cobyrinate a,c-diamide synthase [Paracoccaceae bacterium]